MDYGLVLIYLVVAVVVFGFIFRKQLRAWWIRQKLKKAGIATGTVEPPVLSTRLYELEKVFGPFGSDAAHPSALLAHPQFIEAVRLLALPSVSLAVVLQYVEGNSWSLSSAAIAALRKRADRSEATERVLSQCGYYSPWAMYFALDFLAAAAPRVAVGAPLTHARDWWIDNRWMPNVFRDYFTRCADQGDDASFGSTLDAPGVSSQDTIRRFLQQISHDSATVLLRELDLLRPASAPPTNAPKKAFATLAAVGRFWLPQHGIDTVVEPQGWREALALAESTLRQDPPRSLLVSGEPLVGKTSFLQLLAQRLVPDDWSVFEAGGADLQADQVYIGELEGRIRKVVEELAQGHKLIWYIPDILQVAMSGRHQGQSATMLDQIMPAVATGRLVVWCEATAKGTARLLQLKPSLRGLFETVTLEALSPAESLSLAREVIEQLDAWAHVRFEPDCAKVALDTASQYLGTGGLPGSALFMLKLTALRAEQTGEPISTHQVLETLSQYSGLPVSILDTKGQLDLKSIRDFFTARVIGQDEAVEAMIARIAMLKAGLNDPNKPIGVFLFAGPTGTGKTELAKAVSEFLFGSVERMIRLDMSEFQTHETISKILGQSGASFGETDSLISRVRKQPFSVILLDEFEKSHPNIWDLFLQAFDEGRLTDAMGQVADLRHCLIILTSNLGATAHRSMGLGFAPQADEFSKDQVLRAIAQTYRPEFQNRLDKVIVFRPLTRDLMRGILKKQLAALLERRGLKDRAWAIEWESSALEFLLEKGFSPEMGARPLKRAIDQYLVAPLAAIIVEKRFPEGEQFLFVRSDGEGIQAEFVDPDADVAAADQSAAVAPAVSPALASIILAPEGTQAEFAALQAEYDGIARRLASDEWENLKESLLSEMSSADFWSRSDRFNTLARLALMDRVRSAAETADALRTRLARGSRRLRPYSAELSGRLAMQLHLIKEGIRDALDDAPIELALAVEPVFDGAGDRQATLLWCRKLTSMYRAWADKRRMHISDIAGRSKDKETPILLISGFGSHRVLAPEAGLHVFEPFEGSGNRVTVRVRLAVVPLGDVPTAKERRLAIEAIDQAPRPNTVVRRYREAPPLVRDAAGQWRSGRLDLVLGGEFDLLQAGQR
ncbi:MAG TPA: AAA family ATPase [Xanthobacteraceae bacterium]|nr:AAA family ATPase [Xanthobacteraceae bacterium]